MVKIWWLAAFLSFVLAGCASVPFGRDSSAQSPVSQQAVVGDARRGAKAHADLGTLYLREGQLNIALDEARVAIADDATYPLGYNLLGLVQMYLKEDPAAEEAFARALELAPTDPEINNNYGWFLCQSGRNSESLAYFVTASKSTLYPTPTKPLTNAGVCAITGGDDKSGEEFLLKALRAEPMNGEARFMLADLYYRNGRLNEARTRLADLLRTNEISAQTLWLSLRIERKAGDREMEARYASQLRRNFRDSRENQLLMQGQYQ